MDQLTLKQAALLSAIGRSPGSYQSELFSSFPFSPANRSNFDQQLARLEEKGFLRKARVGNGVKLNRLYLTKRGEEAFRLSLSFAGFILGRT